MNLDFAALQENIDDCDARIAASGAVLGMLDEKLAGSTGRLPTAAEMEGCVRAFVQAVEDHIMNGSRRNGDPEPRGFLRLPVRQMSGPYPLPPAVLHAGTMTADQKRRLREDWASAHGGGSGGAPAVAGLTRLATDGERNGRMAWVPGAQA